MDCAHDMLEKVFILQTICFSIQYRERARKWERGMVNVHTQQKMLMIEHEHTQHRVYYVIV